MSTKSQITHLGGCFTLPSAPDWNGS